MDILPILEQFFLGQPVHLVMIQTIAIFGWLFFAWLLLYLGLFYLGSYKYGKENSTWEWTLLAIDIPQMNMQTPKAVEQLFAHIFSIWEPPSIGNTYRRGYRRQFYSFEIVSIEGYIQFLIRVRKKYRNVIEAAVYAQYPGAEITEVEDYVNSVPDKYPNDTHNMWAAEYLLTQPSAFPIRMYKDFEHNISKDEIMKDPMGTLLESFSRIGPGEQVWFQLIIEPIAEKLWKEDVIKEIKKLIGEKAPPKKTVLDSLTSNRLTKEMANSTNTLLGQLTGAEGGLGADAVEDKKDSPNNLLYLTPGQKKLVEAMEEKIGKIGFNTKIRLVYAAEKAVYNPSRAINSFTGAMNQFNVPSSNTLLPKYMTSTQYLFADARKDYRRRILMKAYKTRNINMGKYPFVLNVEELATIWHFPMSHVSTPLLQKAKLKTAEPPSALPVESISVSEEAPSLDIPAQQTYQTDVGDVAYDDGEIEFG